MTEENEAAPENELKNTNISVLRSTRENIEKLVGREPSTYYDASAVLITDTCQMAVLDHSKEVLEIAIIDGEYLNRRTLPEGAVVQGRYLVVGTAKGDYRFKGVKAMIGVIAKSPTNIIAVTAAILDSDAEIAEVITPDSLVANIKAQQNEGA